MRAIDLYSGIGGWSLGLRLAGVEVVAAYEWWSPACDTYNANLGGNANLADIRALDLRSLPKRIDLIAGSPPCTEFSYSNRGGSGDLSEGMRDLVRFFEIVRHVRPTYWVMENVPRVTGIVRNAMEVKGGPLFRFRSLAPELHTIDFSDFGLPQARKRCLIGNIPFDRLFSYARRQPTPSLGDVVTAIARPRRVKDPVWGISLPRGSVTEIAAEKALDSEQLRMNRAAKLFHPVYNRMSFPDVLTVPSRTVTATCTRVSRESIVIVDPLHPKSFRRLTIRERATLQGFPITYQIFGTSYSQKVKMVGNALPPPIAFLIAHAVKGTDGDKLPSFREAGANLKLPKRTPKQTPPERQAWRFPKSRRFRAAIPSLRLGSGVRFDLSNGRDGSEWSIQFFYGPSKDVQALTPDGAMLRSLRKSPLLRPAFREARKRFDAIDARLTDHPPDQLQLAWSWRSVGAGPFELVDLLGDLAAVLQKTIMRTPHVVGRSPKDIVIAILESHSEAKLARARKITEHAAVILAGFVVASWFNANDWHTRQLARPTRRNTRAKG